MPIDFREDRPYAIICPEERKDDFLRLKRDNPSLDIALYTKEEAVSLFGLNHDIRSLIYLLKQGLSYALAKELLEAFCAPFFLKSTSKKLLKYKGYYDELLSQGYLWPAFAPGRSFASRHVYIDGYAETKRISETVGTSSSNMMIDFLLEERKDPPSSYLKFPDIYEELHYVLNDIARRIDEGTPIDNIYIAGASQEHFTYLSDFSSLYGFSIDVPTDIRLIDHPLGRFLEEKCLEGNLEAVFEEAAKEFPDVDLNSFEKEALPVLSSFDDPHKRKNLFRELLKAHSMKPKKMENCVHLLSHFLPPKGAIVYLIHFAMGSFPPIYKESGYLSDVEREEIGLGSAREETIDEAKRLDNLLHSGQIALISMKQQAFGKSYFLSGLASTYGIKESKPPFQEYEYSHAHGAYLLASLLDKKRNYDEDDERIAPLRAVASDLPYRDYDYRFTGYPSVKTNPLIGFNQSALNEYMGCPFRYLYSRYLNVDKTETNWHMRLGNVFHKVLERHAKERDLSHEELYRLAIEEEELKGPFNAKEAFFLEHLKPYSQKNVLFYDEFEGFFPDVKTEEETFFKSQVSDKALIYGRYDKLLTFELTDKYLIIIDYKSGPTSFDLNAFLDYGLNPQLPFYALAMQKSKKYHDYKIAGLFIGPLLNLTFDEDKKDDYSDEDRAKMALNGVYWASSPFWSSFNFSKKQKGRNTMIAGMTFKKEGGIIEDAPAALSEEKLQNICDSLLDWLNKAASGIQGGDFSIRPVRVKGVDDACGKCPYRDVCYRSERDFPILGAKDDEEETEGGESDGMDD